LTKKEPQYLPYQDSNLSNTFIPTRTQNNVNVSYNHNINNNSSINNNTASSTSNNSTLNKTTLQDKNTTINDNNLTKSAIESNKNSTTTLNNSNSIIETSDNKPSDIKNNIQNTNNINTLIEDSENNPSDIEINPQSTDGNIQIAKSDNTSNTSQQETQNTSKTIRQIINNEHLKSDKPLETNNMDIMNDLFEMCQGPNTCGDINTTDNIYIMEQSIFLNEPEKEFIADGKSVEFLSQTGYHLAGLKGYLNTVNLIENIKKATGSDTPPTIIDKSINFSLARRHPETLSRIDRVNKIISDIKENGSNSSTLNKDNYKTEILSIIQLTPKVKKALDIIHNYTDERDYIKN
ncbi:MAG: hypothetical protein AB1782_11110, partial [Cyanobacteriota bacterium]